MLKVVHRLNDSLKSYIYIYRFACLILLALISILSISSGATFAANSANIDASVTVKPSLTLTIPTNTININLNPGTNPFAYQDLNVTVGTNNPTGYNLMMSADSTNLVNTADSTKTIQTLGSGTYDDTTFTVNRWGYKNGLNSNYKAFTGNDTILSSDTKANNDSTTLRFASKIDYMNPSGNYQTEFTFAATANPTVDSMQDLDPTLCTTTPTTVIDDRDNQEYVIQRLADGKCWMMTNLDLGSTNLTTDLTSSNTNLSSTVPATTFNSWRKTSGTGTYTAGEFIPVTASNSATSSDTDPTSGTKYGTLYNYCAASAGTICTDTNSSNASYDLCPKGWRLPTGGSSGELQTLYSNSSYNTNAKMRNPISSGGAAFALAGNFYNSTPTTQGSYGFYWSSTRYSGTSMYGLLLGTSNVGPADISSRYYGRSIRCVLKDTTTTISDITYMQDINPDIVANTADNATKTLTDKRDSNTYTVAKINGNIWMTQNLRYKGDTGSSSSSMTIKTATSNINTDKTVSYTDLTSGNTYDSARIHNSNNTTTGIWYNYAAASAMTITGDSNTNDATYDICPRNWRLPTYSEQSGIISYSSAYAPVGGGDYWSSSLYNTSGGYWWSSTSSSATHRYYLDWSNSALKTDTWYRSRGNFVRCIAQ